MKKSERIVYSIARSAAVVALVLAGILSILMIANYLQTKAVDPLNSQAIVQLMEQLREDPNNQSLKDQIRALDLLARKAYFTHLWQLRTGGYLLFSFVLVFLIAFKYMNSFKTYLPDLKEAASVEATWENRLLSRKYLIYGALALFALAFVLGIFSQSDIQKIGRPGGGGIELSAFPGLEELRENWPNFRGPEGIGIAYHTDVPTEWDGATGKNIVWKTPIPQHGFNSPIIWEDKIFLSGADRRTQVVYCIASDSGKILWEQTLDDVPGSPEQRPRVNEDTGFAAPTMATDGQRIYVVFATGDIGAFDLEGKRIWAKNLGMPENHYGHSSSLITYQDTLLVQYDQNSGGHLLGLNSRTGAVLYDTPRDTEISWASPILVNTGSRDEVILNSNPYVISYDPRTGKELWRVRCMLGEIAPSLAYTDGWVYAVNEYARLAAIDLSDPSEVAWEYIDDLSEVSSPVAADGLLFMPSSYGTVTCFDAKTGERLWLHEHEEGFYSSPVLVGEHVYLMDMDGLMLIFKADREFQLVASNSLGERAMTIPAFMPGRIYIRGERHLYCIGE
jgi:outer membrane protein assembly factor BamB